VISLADDGQITATLQFMPGETVPIWIFAASMPVVSADGATVSTPVFDATTSLYQVMLAAGENTTATISISPGPAH
jgi:hypothetical protein